MVTFLCILDCNALLAVQSWVVLILQQNVLIQNLNLSWNGFGIDGAKALGEALKVNPVVEELDIS